MSYESRQRYLKETREEFLSRASRNLANIYKEHVIQGLDRCWPPLAVAEYLRNKIPVSRFCFADHRVLKITCEVLKSDGWVSAGQDYYQDQRWYPNSYLMGLFEDEYDVDE
jgi:hypothetical protein